MRSDADETDDGESEASALPDQDSLPADSLGATTRALMARGRRLSTIYSRVSAISSMSSQVPGLQLCPTVCLCCGFVEPCAFAAVQTPVSCPGRRKTC